MLACYYPQGKQHGLDQSQPWGLRGLSFISMDSYKIWEVHIRPQRGARRGFATTERALRVSVSAKTDDHKLGFGQTLDELALHQLLRAIFGVSLGRRVKDTAM